MADRSADVHAPARTPWLLYVGLSAVVWGLFVPDQGAWHDDVQNLFRAYVAPERGEGWFPAIATPTRRLLGLPFLVALGSGHPVVALHLISALAWLATGALADRLARRLWPEAPAAAPLAAALTLCAASDFFTDAPLAVAYQLSIVAFLGALLLGLAWLQAGSRLALWTSPLCLAGALWTSDAALAAWALAPLLWIAAPGPVPAGETRGRRRLALAALWYVTSLPYLVLVIRQFTGHGYLQQALVPLGAGAWLRRCASLLLWNFTPWRWAFERPLWYPSTGVVIPPGVRLALALAAGGIAALALLRATPRVEGGDRWHGGAAALASLALMAATNAAFASVQLSDLFCRTHLLARVFASLALAWLVAAAWARARTPTSRSLVRVAVGAWLALGLAGALERQDYFVGYARAHRQELGSLLTAVPALAPDARLLLRIPQHGAYLATEAGYLARAWVALLYEDSSLECRVFLWSAHRPTTCRATAEGFLCQGERSPDCRRHDGSETELLRYERLVLVEYEPAANAYVLRQDLPVEASLGEARYRPQDQVLARPRTKLARALLEESEGLAARLWP